MNLNIDQCETSPTKELYTVVQIKVPEGLQVVQTFD